MRRLLAWLRRPYDRCAVGGHRMGTKAGYSMCRKHGGDVDWGPRHPGDEIDPTARVGWPAPKRWVLTGDLDSLEFAVADYIARWGEHLTGRPYIGEFGPNIAGIPVACANMAMTVIRKNITPLSDALADAPNGAHGPDSSS